MASKTAIAGIIVLIIIVVAIAAYVSLGTGTSSYTSTTSTIPASTTISGGSGGTSYSTVPVGMTDPPTTPAGTQAVIVSYSNVQVHTTGSNGGSWVSATGSGTVNALAVVNTSQTLADAQLAVNSTIDAVRINVTSVNVVVNGTSHAASAPGWITANVTANQTVHSNSAVLVNLATYVTANSSGNTTAYSYTTSSAQAVMTTNATVSVNVGATVNLNAALKSTLGLSI